MGSLFVAGQIFLDLKAINADGVKGKFFIALNDAEDDDDPVIACVLNTEKYPEIQTIGCNKPKQRFFLPLGSLKFQTNPTTIILLPVQYYELKDILGNVKCKLIENASDLLLRQIKNCLDKDNIPTRFKYLLK